MANKSTDTTKNVERVKMSAAELAAFRAELKAEIQAEQEESKAAEREALKAELREEMIAQQEEKLSGGEPVAEPQGNTESEEQKAYLEEIVSIIVPRFKKEEPDIAVTINGGKTLLIQRGKRVNVPRAVAILIEQSCDQVTFADEFKESITDQCFDGE